MGLLTFGHFEFTDRPHATIYQYVILTTALPCPSGPPWEALSPLRSGSAPFCSALPCHKTIVAAWIQTIYSRCMPDVFLFKKPSPLTSTKNIGLFSKKMYPLSDSTPAT